MNAGATRALARFCAGVRFEDLPQDVQDLARSCLLDAIGVMLAGATTPLAAGALRAATAFDGSELSSILGTPARRSPTAAALANGTMLEVFELQDGWRLGNNHPCVVIPAVLAAAEWKGAGGRDTLAAIVAGYEVVNRLAWTVVPRHLAGGFLPTGTMGTCGSAAAVSRLLGHDEDAVARALGVAAFILPVSTADNLWCGYEAKPLHAGYAARQGIEAALLAQEGFDGVPLEGVPGRARGFLDVMTGEPVYERLTAGLGEDYTLREVYFKAIPACRHVHGTAEAMLALVREHGLRASDVESVLVSTYALSASRLDRQPAQGGSMIASQFSIPFAAAAALVDGELGMRQFAGDRVGRPEVLDLARRVQVVCDPELDAMYPQATPTRVQVTLRNGLSVSCQIDMPKGDPRVPLTGSELREKFRSLAGMVLGRREVEQVEDIVMCLQDLTDLEPLMMLLRGARA